jgi:hypothetical protein
MPNRTVTVSFFRGTNSVHCGRPAQIRSCILATTMHTAMALILSMIMASLTMTTFHVSAAAQPTPGSALSPTYYDGLCPNRSYGTKQFQATANTVVTAMVRLDPTLMPALTR